MTDTQPVARQYSGLIRITGPDGITWDLVNGTLEAVGDGDRFRGVLRKPADAAIAWWVGPVYLEVPGRSGRVEAFLDPVREEKGEVIVSLSGRAAPPWDEWN